MEENKNLISEELPEDKPEIEEAEVAAENVATHTATAASPRSARKPIAALSIQI